MASKELDQKIRISADTSGAVGEINKATKAVDSFEKEVGTVDGATVKAQTSLGKFTSFLRSRFVFTINDVTNALRGLKEAINTTITLEGQETALRGQLASIGANFDEFIAKLDQAAAGTIATSDLIAASSRALLLGIPADEIADLLEIAGSRARATGDTVAKSFDDITLGIGRGSKLILDNLGFIIDLESAYDSFGATVGTTAEGLSQQQKSQALLNEVLRQGKDDFDALGAAADGTLVKFQQGQAALKNFKNTFDILVSAVGAKAAAFAASVGGAFVLIADKALEVAEGLTSLAARIPVVGNAFVGLAEATEGWGSALDETRESIDKNVTELSLLGTELGKQAFGFDEVSEAAKGSATSTTDYIESLRSAAPVIKIVTDEQGELNDSLEEQPPLIDDVIERNNALRASYDQVADSAARTNATLSARDRRNQADVDAALAAGRSPTLGGTRIRLPGGGSRLVR